MLQAFLTLASVECSGLVCSRDLESNSAKQAQELAKEKDVMILAKDLRGFQRFPAKNEAELCHVCSALQLKHGIQKARVHQYVGA